MLQKNDKIKLNITSIAKTGNGVSRHDGMAVFVPLTAVGDEVMAHIIKVTKSYAVGKIDEIISPSPDRTENDCPAFSKCGGCSFRHISYESELTAKQSFVKDCFERIGGIFAEHQKIVGSEKTEGYRNKAMLPVGRDKNGRLLIGYFRPRSHDITDCRSCRLLPDVFNEAIEKIAEYIEQSGASVYDENTGKGLIRQIYLRMGPTSKELLVCLVTNGADLPKKQLLLDLLTGLEGLASVVQNINTSRTNTLLGEKCITLWGKNEITDTLCGLLFNISPLSFYQINSPQAERLYQKAKEFAHPDGKTLLDLYCGAGTIGLSMADEAKKIIGAEIVSDAIQNAKNNAEQNGIKNAEFLCADAKDAAQIFKNEGIKPDVILLDPPRKGCDESVITTVCEMSPERVVYISCDPATCARDCAVFESLGYKVQKVASFDLFPRTAHVETVALLSRQIDVHNMKLHPSPFEKIKSGQKTIDLRLFDEKRQQIKAGDMIVFTNTATGETLTTTVVNLHRFNSFEELYKSLPLLQCGYTTENVDNAKPSDMEQYYSLEDQKNYGVVGIELCRPKQIADESVALLVNTDSAI